MKLVTFGCSLTHNYGLTEELANLLNVDLLNLAYTAGSNQLQINRFHEAILNKQIDKTDIVYWQVTSVIRGYNRLQMNRFEEIDKTQFGNFWQDARYVYKDGDALGPPYLRQVWGIVTSTTASDLFPTSKLGDIRFFNTVKVDQLLMASTISSLNGLTNLGAGGAAGNGPPAGFFNLAFNPTTGQLGYYS
jgi:hypothetical protein